MSKKGPINMLAGQAPCFRSIIILCFIITTAFAPVAGSEPENKVLVLKVSEAVTPASDDILASDDIIANAITKYHS